MNVHDALQAYVAGKPARAVYFRDLKGGVAEWGHRADEPMPSASVMKLAVAMALYASGLDVAERVPLAALGRSPYCSVWEMFEHTQGVSLAELCNAMLMVSDNPAAAYNTRRVGMDAVNALLQNSGCSVHARMGMDFDDSNPQLDWRLNVLTARDCGILLRAIAIEARYARIRHALVHSLRNNRLAALLPVQAQVAHKTGSISRVANDAALITEGAPAASPVEYILVCLTDGEDARAANTAQADMSLAVYTAMMQGYPHAAPQHRIWLHESL